MYKQLKIEKYINEIKLMEAKLLEKDKLLAKKSAEYKDNESEIISLKTNLAIQKSDNLNLAKQIQVLKQKINEGSDDATLHKQKCKELMAVLTKKDKEIEYLKTQKIIDSASMSQVSKSHKLLSKWRQYDGRKPLAELKSESNENINSNKSYKSNMKRSEISHLVKILDNYNLSCKNSKISSSKSPQ